MLIYSLDENLKSIEFSSKKLIDMGFSFKYSLEEMLVESIETCRKKGFLLVSSPDQTNSEEVPSIGDNIEHKTGAVLTDGMKLCMNTEPGITAEKSDNCMPAQQMCA